MADTEERIAQLEKTIAELKERPPRKDAWDIFSILATLLIPASITFVGYVYSQSQKDAEIRSAEAQAERQEIVARINARVGQAGLVASFLDALVSPDAQKRKLAVKAVLIALPEDGPGLVQILMESEANTDIARYARTSLDERRTALVRQLYSDEPQQRTAAADQLARGWRSDPKIVDTIVQSAQKEPQNKNGVYNSVAVLNSLDDSVLKARRDQIVPFTREAAATGERTKAAADKLRARVEKAKD